MLRAPGLCRKVGDASPAMRNCSESLQGFVQGEGDASPEKYPFAESEKLLSGGQGRFRISPLRPPDTPLTRGVTSCAGSNLPQAEDATRFAVPPFPMESPLRYHFPRGPKEGSSIAGGLSVYFCRTLHAAQSAALYSKI